MSRQYHHMLAVLLLSCASWAAHAKPLETDASSAAYDTCMEHSDGVTAKMQSCIQTEFQRQDARLNQSYKAALMTLSPAKQQQLRNIQRLWIQFRDQECGFYSDLTGGSIDRINSAQCLLDMTQTRADNLEALTQEGN